MIYERQITMHTSRPINNVSVVKHSSKNLIPKNKSSYNIANWVTSTLGFGTEKFNLKVYNWDPYVYNACTVNNARIVVELQAETCDRKAHRGSCADRTAGRRGGDLVPLIHPNFTARPETGTSWCLRAEDK